MNNLFSIPEKEWLAIVGLAAVLHLKKGALLVEEGEKNYQEYFIKSGVVRGFITDDKGNEKSTAFFEEGEFVSARSLRTSTQGMSMYGYQALCPAEILVFNSVQLKKALSATPRLTELGKKIKEKEMARLAHRDHCLLQATAADKYLKFFDQYPRLESRVSQRFIASYLGITPISLSRLKKSLLTKTVIN